MNLDDLKKLFEGTVLEEVIKVAEKGDFGESDQQFSNFLAVMAWLKLKKKVVELTLLQKSVLCLYCRSNLDFWRIYGQSPLDEQRKKEARRLNKMVTAAGVLLSAVK